MIFLECTKPSTGRMIVLIENVVKIVTKLTVVAFSHHGFVTLLLVRSTITRQARDAYEEMLVVRRRQGNTSPMSTTTDEKMVA